MKKKFVIGVITIVGLCLTVSGCFGKKANQQNTTQTYVTYNEERANLPSSIDLEPNKEKIKFITAAEGFSGGDGTEENPYQITSIEELAFLSEMTHFDPDQDGWDEHYGEKHYILMNDISLNDVTDFEKWGPEYFPEYSWQPIHFFEGTFDGQGHTISGLYSNFNCRQDSEAHDAELFRYIGLFGYTSDAEIKNLTIKDSYFIGFNCFAVGSVAGRGCGLIENCTNYATVYGSRCVDGIGGIAGDGFRCDLINCQNYGTINGVDTMDVGGIVAQDCDASIKNCINYGKVLFGEYTEKAGGIVGLIINMNEISGCQNKSALEGKVNMAYVGGIIGSVSCGKVHTLITDCVNEGEISISGNDSNIGGCFGNLYSERTSIDNEKKNCGNLEVTNCRNTAPVKGSGDINIAGMAGEMYAKHSGDFVISNCVNTADITGENDCTAAGFAFSFGNNFGGNISMDRCMNEGTVRSDGLVGGLIGLCNINSSEECPSNLKVLNCVNNGEVHGKGWGNGGIIGSSWYIGDEGQDSVLIDGCTNNGDVYAYFDGAILTLGGIVSDFDYSTDKEKSQSTYVLSNNISNGDVILVSQGNANAESMCFIGKTCGYDHSKGMVEIKGNIEKGKIIIE